MKIIKFAGFWVRLVAYLIDSIIIYFVSSIISTIVLLLGFLTIFIDESGTIFFLVLIVASFISVILSLVYFIVMPITKFQGTFGKVIMGIKIVDKNGERITFLYSLLRFVGYFLSGILFYIGYIMIGFHEEKRGLHDLIASTYVVEKR